MTFSNVTRLGITLLTVASLTACSGIKQSAAPKEEERKSTLFDLLGNKDDPNTTLQVNKYIWNASLEILNFLPVESVDPFGGVIVTGFGSPPGGGAAYRATIYVQDPALDARSLKLSLVTRNGPASAATVNAV